MQRAEARQRLANGETADHLAKLYGVSRARSIVRACKSELAEGTGWLPTCLPLVLHDGPVACDLRGPVLPLTLPPGREHAEARVPAVQIVS